MKCRMCGGEYVRSVVSEGVVCVELFYITKFVLILCMHIILLLYICVHIN